MTNIPLDLLTCYLTNNTIPTANHHDYHVSCRVPPLITTDTLIHISDALKVPFPRPKGIGHMVLAPIFFTDQSALSG